MKIEQQIDSILGIPIFFDHRVTTIAAAKGVLAWKRIVVGRHYFELRYRERWAVLYHEAKHCLDWHMEKRIGLIPIFWTRFAARIVCQQELDADRFAAENGYGVEMILVIRRFFTRNGEFYPPVDDRCERLSRFIRERFYVEQAA